MKQKPTDVNSAEYNNILYYNTIFFSLNISSASSFSLQIHRSSVQRNKYVCF